MLMPSSRLNEKFVFRNTFVGFESRHNNRRLSPSLWSTQVQTERKSSNDAPWEALSQSQISAPWQKSYHVRSVLLAWWLFCHLLSSMSRMNNIAELQLTATRIVPHPVSISQVEFYTCVMYAWIGKPLDQSIDFDSVQQLLRLLVIAKMKRSNVTRSG